MTGDGPPVEPGAGTDEATYLRHLRQLWDANRPAGLAAEPVHPFGEIPLTEYLRSWARERPDHPVVIWYGAELTYARLDDLSDRFASYLRAQGFAKGDRVAVLLSNCPQSFVVFYGIMKAGCVYVPLNPMFKAAELAHELEDAGATGIVTLEELEPLVQEVREATGLRMVLTTRLTDELPPEPVLPLPPNLAGPRRLAEGPSDLLQVIAGVPVADDLGAPGLDDLAALNYTGGTTGMPKGCEHTQREMVYTAATASTYFGSSSSEDVALVFVPVFWIAGEDGALILPVFTGSTVVLLNRWDPGAVLAAIDRYKVTKMTATVDNYVELLEHTDLARFDLRSLKAPAAMSFIRKLGVDERRAWQAAVGEDCVLREASYGLTETHTIDTYTTGMQDDDFDLRSRPVFVGLPMPGTDVKIVDFERGTLCPLGAEGEIVIRSPSVTKGYWNKPEATAASLRDGWLHTGDIGLLDEDGYLHYLGRNKEMLKVKGMSVFPSEVEALLGRHPDVAGCAVVGREDPERGEVPVAFVQLRSGRPATSPDELVDWCRRNMAVYKVPELRFVDALPLTATGKVRKDPLRELL